MAGEPIKSLLLLPPGTTPASAAILIVQTLECKKLACKCELSKDILQFALKILLCDDDSSLYPNQKINGVFQTRQCADVSAQTDNRNQYHASVQTEKSRIKLQNSGYKYTFNGCRESYNVATQVTFNDFSDMINSEDSDEVELYLESPTEISKNKVISENDNQIIQYTAKRQKKCTSGKHTFPTLDFHGKRLIDETKSRPPFSIPLTCRSEAEVCDPRIFDSSISNKHEDSSHFPWKAQAICRCVSVFKQKRSYDQKENNIDMILTAKKLNVNLPVTNIDNRDSSSVTPLNAVSPNRLNTKEKCHLDISNNYIQSIFKKKDSSITKVRRTTKTKGSPVKDHKEAHLRDCFCNLAPVEACASDPRIKLICAHASTDVKTSMKRNSGCSGNKSLLSKKTKFEKGVEQISITSNTTEQFGCLTPNESPNDSLETPINSPSLSLEPFTDQKYQNNVIQKSSQQMSFDENHLNKTPSANIESEYFVPSSKNISPISEESDLFLIRESNRSKSSTPSCSLIEARIECNKNLEVKNDQAIHQFSKDSNILKEPHDSTNLLPKSFENVKNKTINSITIENTPKLSFTNTDINVREEISVISNQNISTYEQFSDIKKSTSSAKNFGDSTGVLQNLNLEYKNNITNSTYLSGHLQTENKDCNNLIENSSTDTHNISISDTHNISISDNIVSGTSEQQNECSKVRMELDKLLNKSRGTTLQKILSENSPEESSQSVLQVHHKNEGNPESDTLNIPCYYTVDSNNNQPNKEKNQLEEIYSSTDELSPSSDRDNALPTGCITSFSPDKLSTLQLNKSNKLVKTKEKQNHANPYQKIIAAVPSYMPTRQSPAIFIDKLCISKSDKCDKMTKSMPKTSQDATVSKTNEKIDYDIPEYTTGEPDSTMPMPLYTIGRLMENEMTRTEPEVKDWNNCSPWFQQQSFHNYYKWYGQGSEFAPHHQTYYPPYTNNYPAIASNWMCYQWWNGNGNGWNQLW